MKIPTVQLALDCSSTEEAIRDCQTGVVDEVDILECGYSLIAACRSENCGCWKQNWRNAFGWPAGFHDDFMRLRARHDYFCSGRSEKARIKHKAANRIVWPLEL